MKLLAIGSILATLLLAACGSDDSDASENSTTLTPSPGAIPVQYRADVWADNWFAMYINGELIGEDSVPATTEQSFNAETINFSATPPFTVGIIAKDFAQDDTGLEYVGTDRQQMGDGGLIAQITEVATGTIVAGTNDTWMGFVAQRAPVNPECEKSPTPEVECRSETIPEPEGWAEPGFDDSGWQQAMLYSAAQVGAKEGYDTIDWGPDTLLIWTEDLETDNVTLWRTVVTDDQS